MNLLKLLLGVCLTVAGSLQDAPALLENLPCGIPFPFSNHTRQVLALLNETEGTVASTDIWGNEQYRSGPLPWPRGGLAKKNLVNIRYCYATPYDRLMAKLRVETAISVWYTALGGYASEKSGHAIQFDEAKDKDGYVQYCQQEGDYRGWNKNIPMETVAVMWQSSYRAISGATIGYYSSELDNEPWKMSLYVGYNKVHDVTHSLGHILGMADEQSRSDRNDYIKYTCSNLADFDWKLKRAQKIDPTIDEHRLCTDFNTALRHGFKGLKYIDGYAHGLPGKGFPTRLASLKYDFGSIMAYGSAKWARKGCLQDSIDKCPLAKYKYGKDRPDELEFMSENKHPSATDVDWIQVIYPWHKPGT